MIGILDTLATVAYLTACGVILYSLIFIPDRIMTATAILTLIAMAVMAVDSAGNAASNLGLGGWQGIEEYLEVLFVPVMVYVMYGRYRTGHVIRQERERMVVNRLADRLNDSMAEMGEHRVGMLQSLSAAVDARDHYTAQHSMHVADYACAIAYRMGLKDDLTLFEQAGLLHDIGKIGVPDSLLLKPARLTDEEYEQIKRHVEESAQIIEAVPFLSDVVPMVKHHHERWDGSGYPGGLAGEKIPLAARVLAVADAFDAMTTDRPYRAAMGIDDARRILVEGSGKQFDPQVVGVFLDLIREGIVLAGERLDDKEPAIA